MEGDLVRQEKMQREVEAREQELEERTAEMQAENAALEEDVGDEVYDVEAATEVESRGAEPRNEERR